MEKYDYIEDVILTVDEGNVAKKNKPVALSLALLALGAVVLYMGIAMQEAAGEILSSLLLMTGLVVMVAGGVLLVVKKGGYVYVPTGKELKKHKLYIAPDKSFKLQQVLRDGTYGELSALRQPNASNSTVVVFLSDDGEYALLQVLEFVPYNDVPTTPVIVCRGDAARALASVMKG